MNFVYDRLFTEYYPRPETRGPTKFRKTMGNRHELGTLLSMYNDDDWDEVKWEHFVRTMTS